MIISPATPATKLPITFDAVGTGGTVNPSNKTTGTISWTHTATGNLVIAFVSTTGPSTGITTRTCTYGATPMTSMTAFQFETGASNSFIEVWTLFNPPIGAQTITANITISSGYTFYFTGNSTSYNNVNQLGTPVTNSATSTSLSSTAIASAVGQMVAQCFVDVATSSNITAYNQTKHWSSAGPTTNFAQVIGDAAGAASVSFTASDSTSAIWGSVAVPIT